MKRLAVVCVVLGVYPDWDAGDEGTAGAVAQPPTKIAPIANAAKAALIFITPVVGTIQSQLNWMV